MSLVRTTSQFLLNFFVGENAVQNVNVFYIYIEMPCHKKAKKIILKRLLGGIVGRYQR